MIQSITANGKSLILTGIFGAAVIYLFSVVAYLQFPDHFVDEDGDPVCTNLTACFLFVLMKGLRQGGGVGDVLFQSKPTDQLYTRRMIFDFVFFVVVVVILLNIIFGIIIDTFGELRDQVRSCPMLWLLHRGGAGTGPFTPTHFWFFLVFFVI